jgi:outer membrane lipoprotein-sorting protein
MTINVPRQRVRQMMAFASITAALLVVLPAYGGDASVPDVKISAVLDGSGVREADASPGQGGALVETIWLKGTRVRVDFDGGPNMHGRILRDDQHAWLLQPGTDRALPADNVPLGAITRLDTRNPCFALGFACEHADDRLIAGRRASGWRYSDAGHAGPNSTDSGVFWIDAQYGVLLAFNATDVDRRTYHMETASVDFANVPDSTFEPPPTMQAAWEAK